MEVLVTDDNLALFLLLNLSEHLVGCIRVFHFADFNPRLKHLCQKGVLGCIVNIELHFLLKELFKWCSDDVQQLFPPDFSVLFGG